MSAPITFRVYPLLGRRYPYARVVVHPTIRALRATVRREERATMAGRDAVASTRKGRPGREVCTMQFARELLTTEVVTHECLHAAFSWATRARLPILESGVLPLSSEEALAYAQGRMVWQCVDGLIRRGLTTAEDLCRGE